MRKLKADYRMYFEDDVPRFGCGERGIKVDKVGRKWATLIECSTGVRVKVPIDLFNRLKKHARQVAA